MKLNAQDKLLLRAVIAQAVALLATGGNKSERYIYAAEACEQLAARLRERAAEAAPAAAPKAKKKK